MDGDSRNEHGWVEREDDWFAERGELDWLDDPREKLASSAGAQSRGRGQEGDAGAEQGRRAGRGRPGRALPRASPAIIARRRVLALAIIGLLAVSLIAVVVATSGGGSPTPTASTPQ